MRAGAVTYRWFRIALGVCACFGLIYALGAARGLALWTIGTPLICTATALMMRRQPIGKIGFFNYLAGYTLPWGYRIGRGKLWPIVATSWVIWMLLCVAIALSMSTGGRHTLAGVATTQTASPVVESQRSAIVMGLLCLAWLIDGGVLLRFIGLALASADPGRLMRSTFGPMLVLVAMLAVSIALVTLSTTPASARLALLIAGGPPLFVGGAYGVFILVILTAGRNARWN